MKRMIAKTRRRLTSAAGISIVELLVAMAVSLILAGGIYQIFVGSTRSYALNQGLARMQENSRFALHALRSEVRGAGYLGCLQDVGSFTNTLNNPTNLLLNFSQGVYGLEATAVDTWADENGAVDPEATGLNGLGLTSPVSGSDILVVRGVNPDVVFFLETPMPNTSADMKLENGTTGIAKDDFLMITDCQHASVFQVSNYTDTNGNLVHNTGAAVPGNSTSDLGRAYQPGAEIYVPRSMIFYVRNNDAGQPSLYRKIGTGAEVDLVEGVENLQVRYGEDLSGNRAADLYVNADAVTNWQNVVSVRIGLLMRSVDEVPRGPIDTSAYDVSGNGVADFVAPGDRRMRLVKSGTIGLRNRLR